MTSTVDEIYGLKLASSGKLKLRAKSLLAEGDDDSVFKASVLLHEAARIQHRATEVLPECAPVTRLASAVEECWCLVEALDPPRAADAWGDVLRARQGVDDATASAILSRLAPRYEALHTAFVRAIGTSPALHVLRAETLNLTGLSNADRTRARKDLTVLLSQFPGATSFWWMSYRIAEAANDRAEAWRALERARELDPDNPRFKAISLLVAAWALPLAAAEKHLAGAIGSVEEAEPEVCLMYALAEMTLARKTATERRSRWKRAHQAADSGIARSRTEGLRKNLQAVQLVLDALLNGLEPTIEILYVAGLSEMASTAKTDADVVDLLTTRLRRQEPPRKAA